MSASDFQMLLTQLHDLILEERALAKANNVKALVAVVARKEVLLERIDKMSVDKESMGEELQELARKVRFENRRNAYLVWSALNAIRSTMEFFQKQLSPAAYGGAGRRITAPAEGLIISGRV